MKYTDIASDIDERWGIDLVLDARSLESPDPDALNPRFRDSLVPLSFVIVDALRRSGDWRDVYFREVMLTNENRRSDGRFANIRVDASKFRWGMSNEEALVYLEDRVVEGVAREFPVVNRTLLNSFRKNGRKVTWKNELSDEHGRSMLTHRVEPSGYTAELDVDGATFEVHKSSHYWTDWKPLFGRFELKTRQVEISARPSQLVRKGRRAGSTGPSKKTLKFVVSRGDKPKVLRRFFDGWNPNAVPTTRVRFG